VPLAEPGEASGASWAADASVAYFDGSAWRTEEGDPALLALPMDGGEVAAGDAQAIATGGDLSPRALSPRALSPRAAGQQRRHSIPAMELHRLSAAEQRRHSDVELRHLSATEEALKEAGEADLDEMNMSNSSCSSLAALRIASPTPTPGASSGSSSQRQASSTWSTPTPPPPPSQRSPTPQITTRFTPMRDTHTPTMALSPDSRDQIKPRKVSVGAQEHQDAANAAIDVEPVARVAGPTPVPPEVPFSPVQPVEEDEERFSPPGVIAAPVARPSSPLTLPGRGLPLGPSPYDDPGGPSMMEMPYSETPVPMHYPETPAPMPMAPATPGRRSPRRPLPRRHVSGSCEWRVLPPPARGVPREEVDKWHFPSALVLPA